MKVEKNKQIQVKKLESRELIPSIADLTGLFIFSGVNNNRKSKHQWWKICLNEHCSQKGWPKDNTKMILRLGLWIFILYLAHIMKRLELSLLLIYVQRLNLSTTKLKSWNLNNGNSLYQPMVFEYLLNNI